MALKIGSLYVSLTAQTGEFAKGMQGALKSVERFSKEVKKAAGDAMGIGASLTAVGAGALKLASDVSGPTKRALDELSASTKQLAVPIAEALVPAVREASNVIRGIGQAFKELSPETKAAVVTVLQVGAAMTAVGAVVGKLAGTVNLLAGVFSGVFGAIAAIGLGPLLGIVAAIGAVIGAVALLHRAWRQNWGNIQETTASVVEAIKEQFASLVQVVGKLFDWLVDQVATMVDTNLQLVERLQKAFGVQLVDTRGLRAGFQGLFADLKSGEFFNQALQFGKTVGKQIGSGLLEEWKLIGKELGLDDILAKVRGITAGAALTVGPRAAARPVVSGTMMRDPRMVDAGAFVRASAADERSGIIRNMVEASKASREAAEAMKEAVLGQFDALNARGRENAAARNAAREQSQRGTRDSLQNTAQQFIGKLGELGAVINNVAQAASQGGPWAALGAAIAELLSRTKAFEELLIIAANGLRMVTDALQGGAQALLSGLGAALATALQAVAAAVKMMEPLLMTLGDALLRIAPLFLPLATIFKALTPLVELLTDIIFAWVAALSPIVTILSTIVIGVGIAISWTLKQLGTVWNAIVNEIAKVVDTVIAFITAGIVTSGGDFVRKLAVDVTPAAESLRELNEQAKAMGFGTKNVWEILSGQAQQDAAEELRRKLLDTAGAAQAVSEAFLNVPTGYKVAAARFAADAGGLTQFSMPGNAAAGSGVTINGDVTVVTNDPEAFMADLRRVVFRDTGAIAGELGRNVR